MPPSLIFGLNLRPQCPLHVFLIAPSPQGAFQASFSLWRPSRSPHSIGLQPEVEPLHHGVWCPNAFFASMLSNPFAWNVALSPSVACVGFPVLWNSSTIISPECLFWNLTIMRPLSPVWFAHHSHCGIIVDLLVCLPRWNQWWGPLTIMK